MKDFISPAWVSSSNPFYFVEPRYIEHIKPAVLQLKNNRLICQSKDEVIFNEPLSKLKLFKQHWFFTDKVTMILNNKKYYFSFSNPFFSRHYTWLKLKVLPKELLDKLPEEYNVGEKFSRLTSIPVGVEAEGTFLAREWVEILAPTSKSRKPPFLNLYIHSFPQVIFVFALIGVFIYTILKYLGLI